MKKLFCLIVAMVFITGCDDGELTFDNFDFTGVDAQQCNAQSNIYIKKNGTEMLILTLDASALLNVESELDGNNERIPRAITLTPNGANSIIYRNYNGDVSGLDICADVPAATPTVVDEYNGSGTLDITTTKIVDTETGAITYNHSINIRDVSFAKGEEEIRILDNNFGLITKTLGFDFDFEGTESTPLTVQSCTVNGLIFKVNSNEALIIDFPASAFENVADTTIIDLEEPDDEGNYEVLLRVFSGSIAQIETDNNYLCQTSAPLSPVETERWRAVSGTVEIVSVQTSINPEPVTFSHEIRFRDIVFAKEGSNSEIFEPENTEDVDYYLFGTHTTP